MQTMKLRKNFFKNKNIVEHKHFNAKQAPTKTEDKFYYLKL